MLRTRIPVLDELLETHAVELGPDFHRYRNHAYRVANLCAAFADDSEAHLHQIAVAAALHDIGIWTDRTFDYLEPSIRVARAHLVATGHAAWIAELSAMILEHHKVFRYRSAQYGLVEPFRRADWVDVSRGLVTFGLPRHVLQEIFTAWPDLGFRKRLVELAAQRLRTHPLSPLPILRR